MKIKSEYETPKAFFSVINAFDVITTSGAEGDKGDKKDYSVEWDSF